MKSKLNSKILIKFILIFILLLLPLTVTACFGDSKEDNNEGNGEIINPDNNSETDNNDSGNQTCDKIKDVLAGFYIPSEVTRGFTLPSADYSLSGSTTSWLSSNSSVLKIYGSYAGVKRPTDKDEQVYLTVSITFEGVTESKDYSVIVKKGENQNPEPLPDPDPDPDPTPTPNPDTSELKVNIEGVDYGIVKSSEINDVSELTFDKTSKPTALDVIDEYFLVFKYSLTPYKNNDGQNTITAKIRIDNIKYLSGQFFESKGGVKGEGQNVETDNQTGEKYINIPIVSIVSPEADITSEIYVIIKLETLNAGTSSISLSFESSNSKLVGEISGINRAIDVNKVKLDAPVIISFDEQSKSIKFKNILRDIKDSEGNLKKPGYYKAYLDGVVLKDKDGKDFIFEVDEFVGFGSEISMALDQELARTGKTHGKLTIQAFSNSSNFISSNYSNELYVEY